MQFLKKVTEYLFYLFIFLLPWQTKLILRPEPTNFNEISLYAAQFFLLIILLLFLIHRLFGRKENLKIAPLCYFLMGWELFILFSIFAAPDIVLASYYYFAFLIGLGMFFLMRVGTTPGGYEDSFFNKGKVIFSFLLGALLQAGLGIYQFLSQSSFACKYLGLAAHDPAALGTSVVETVSGRWLRAYGALDHPNILGGFLVIALLLAAYQLAKKKILRTKKEIRESIFLFLFYFISLFALFFTFSRASWLALLAGLIILLINFIREKDRWVLSRFVALLFFSLILSAIAVLPFRDLVTARLDDSLPLEQKSITERQTYIGQAINLIKERPIIGVGMGNYTTVLAADEANKNQKATSVWDYQPVHDVFLLMWSENGIFALLFFLAFLFCLIKKDRREPYSQAIMGALLIIMLLDHWLLSLPFGLLFLFFVLGLI